jgi:hypothetical protein
MYYIIKKPLFLDIKLSLEKRLERISSQGIRGVRIIYVYLSPKILFSVYYNKDADLTLENLLQAGAIKL